MREQVEDLALLLRAIKFAAHKHKEQRRKDGRTPYINHPIEVTELLATVGRVSDVEILAAAVLHDTIEDTDTLEGELVTIFGVNITKLVQECTDDKTLVKAERKRLQEERASHISLGAKQIRICDKVSNMRDMVESPPADWSLERRFEYLNWCNRVFQGLENVNPALDDLFRQQLAKSQAALDSVRPASIPG